MDSGTVLIPLTVTPAPLRRIVSVWVTLGGGFQVHGFSRFAGRAGSATVATVHPGSHEQRKREGLRSRSAVVFVRPGAGVERGPRNPAFICEPPGTPEPVARAPSEGSRSPAGCTRGVGTRVRGCGVGGGVNVCTTSMGHAGEKTGAKTPWARERSSWGVWSVWSPASPAPPRFRGFPLV